MRIAVLGCGAMGTILGAYLNKSGLQVDLIDAYKAHVEALNKNGAHITDHVDFTVPVHALLPENMDGIYDLVFLFTKQTANEIVLHNLIPHLGPESTVCTLQNGVPEPFVAKYIGEARTVGGAVLWGATFVEPGVSAQTMDFNPAFPLFDIGEISGEITPRIKMVQDVLNHMGKTDVVSTLMATRWAKLMVNACGSGMSAACGSAFGPLIDSERALDCMTKLGYEVGQCAKAAGYTITGNWENWDITKPGVYEDLKHKFWLNYDFQRGAKASMLQDLEKKQKTEVNMINGYVCETGDKYGIDTPYNDAIVDIVTKIENGELPLSIENLKLLPTL